MSDEQPTGARNRDETYKDDRARSHAVSQLQRIASGSQKFNAASGGDPYTDIERREAGDLAEDILTRAEREDLKGGFGRRTLDNFAFGRVNAAARRGDLPTDDDLARLGVGGYRAEPTALQTIQEEMGINALPYFIFVGPAVLVLIFGAGGVRRRNARELWRSRVTE